MTGPSRFPEWTWISLQPFSATGTHLPRVYPCHACRPVPTAHRTCQVSGVETYGEVARPEARRAWLWRSRIPSFPPRVPRFHQSVRPRSQAPAWERISQKLRVDAGEIAARTGTRWSRRDNKKQQRAKQTNLNLSTASVEDRRLLRGAAIRGRRTSSTRRQASRMPFSGELFMLATHARETTPPGALILAACRRVLQASRRSCCA